VAFVAVITAVPRAWPAGGPENVLLVVNARSEDSLSIANHYSALRHIPGGNFLFLDWDPKQETTDVKTFREKILLPVVRAARLPIPGRQIDYVVYSSGFPWGIRINDDITKFEDYFKQHEKEQGAKPDGNSLSWLKYMTPVGSLNGLTFLWEPVLAESTMSGVLYAHPQSNWYARNGSPEQKNEPSLSFSSSAAYGPHGEAVASGGRRYLLSMMLGVTSGRGNTVDEVLSYLRRSAAADGTHPRGTIYFMQNNDIRSKVRQGGFAEAVKQLKAMGVAAKVLDGTLPKDKPDVQGAMLGVADFDWKSSGSTILPGAICEHFTSFGGEMSSGAGQTPLSELLRYGATAASGTVTEPYAMAAKFPVPKIQVHYARGCTVAESFYQSVLCPYQLLIVGDPLCRPWADIPEITVAGLTEGDAVHGEMKLVPQARFAKVRQADHGYMVPEPDSTASQAGKTDVQVEHFELVLDGQKIRECAPGGTLEFNSTALTDGVHELRIVAESKGPVVARGEKIMAFSSANHGRTIDVTCEPAATVSIEKSLLIKVKSPHAKAIQIVRGTRLLGRIDGDGGQLEVPAAKLGRGPVRIQVVGVGDAGPATSVLAQPLEIDVE